AARGHELGAQTLWVSGRLDLYERPALTPVRVVEHRRDVHRRLAGGREPRDSNLPAPEGVEERAVAVRVLAQTREDGLAPVRVRPLHGAPGERPAERGDDGGDREPPNEAARPARGGWSL